MLPILHRITHSGVTLCNIVIYKKHIFVHSSIFVLLPCFLAHRSQNLWNFLSNRTMGASFFILCSSLSSVPELLQRQKGEVGVLLFKTSPFSTTTGLMLMRWLWIPLKNWGWLPGGPTMWLEGWSFHSTPAWRLNQSLRANGQWSNQSCPCVMRSP